MTDLVGKKLGKLLFVAKEPFPDNDHRRYKYGRIGYRVKCDCGNERMIPVGGAAGMRSCGCSQYERNRTTANETIKHFPNQVVLRSVKDKIYEDI